MIKLHDLNQILHISEDVSKFLQVHEWHSNEDYYLVCNGKRVINGPIDDGSIVHVVPRLPGGKGGFGSMLRAIGAQIEKTTNREACRDLSGRRLRDINEEKRLKAWIDQQATREQEAADKKQKKLERLCEKPKHEFKDDMYFKEKSELPSRVEEAVEQGLSASASTSSNNKRKSDAEDKKKIKKKKHSLWVEDGLEDLSSSEENSENSETEEENVISKASSSSKEKEAEKSGDSNDGSVKRVVNKDDCDTEEKNVESKASSSKETETEKSVSSKDGVEKDLKEN